MRTAYISIFLKDESVTLYRKEITKPRNFQVHLTEISGFLGVGIYFMSNTGTLTAKLPSSLDILSL